MRFPSKNDPKFLTNGSKTSQTFSKLRLNEIEPVFLRKSQFFPHKFPHKFENPHKFFHAKITKLALNPIEEFFFFKKKYKKKLRYFFFFDKIFLKFFFFIFFGKKKLFDKFKHCDPEI